MRPCSRAQCGRTEQNFLRWPCTGRPVPAGANRNRGCALTSDVVMLRADVGALTGLKRERAKGRKSGPIRGCPRNCRRRAGPHTAIASSLGVRRRGLAKTREPGDRPASRLHARAQAGCPERSGRKTRRRHSSCRSGRRGVTAKSGNVGEPRMFRMPSAVGPDSSEAFALRRVVSIVPFQKNCQRRASVPSKRRGHPESAALSPSSAHRPSTSHSLRNAGRYHRQWPAQSQPPKSKGPTCT